jgi:hypothetical protein
VNGTRLPRPTIGEDFRKRLRAELMNEAVALAEERRSRRSSLPLRLALWWSSPLRPVAVAATLVAVLVAGAGTAAAGSLPGDPTFVLKQAAEQVELALATSDDQKVQVLATQAQRRLEELARTTERPDKSPTASVAYEAAVARFAAAVEALRAAEPGQKHEAVEQVVEAARDKHVVILEELKDRLPPPAQEKIETAIREHEKLAPGKPDRPRPTERPGGVPASPTASPAPRVTETPRGGRPTPSSTPTRH